MTPGFAALLILIALVDGVCISVIGPGGTHPTPVGGLKRWLAVILVLVGVYLLAGGRGCLPRRPRWPQGVVA